MNTERWLPIPGFEATYEVSSYGRVKRVAPGRGTYTGRLRKLVPRNGYFQVLLSQNDQVTLCWVHRLVALAFLEPQDDRPEVNHIDGNRQNNLPENLEWVTRSENTAHAYRIGLKHAVPNRGSKNGNAKLTENDIATIKVLHNQIGTNELARRYAITPSAISHVIHGRGWRHVP